jgi:copper chaperone NosL
MGQVNGLPCFYYNINKFHQMQKARIKGWVRWILALCVPALIAVLFFPMWRIDLQAPQYPEGLRLLIYPDKLAGNVDIINGLNHYIGMKTLHSADFIEFTVLPYIIVGIALIFLVVAFMGKRKMLNLLFVFFVGFGILAMYDFWRWEYNYGHNLNPEAAIIVPGMAYQPPLIGFKQLLNFGAYSVPDTGGWIFIGVGILLLFCFFAEWWRARNAKTNIKGTAALMILLASMSSCNAGPEQIKTGVDHCYFCKMTISDVRFGAELVTQKGKIYKFDDMHCILSYLKTGELDSGKIKNIYFTNFCGNHQLVHLKNAVLLKSESFRSPMGGNIASFDNRDSLAMAQRGFPGSMVNWVELKKQ